jgi:hypothetical protein
MSLLTSMIQPGAPLSVQDSRMGASRPAAAHASSRYAWDPAARADAAPVSRQRYQPQAPLPAMDGGSTTWVRRGNQRMSLEDAATGGGGDDERYQRHYPSALPPHGHGGPPARSGWHSQLAGELHSASPRRDWEAGGPRPSRRWSLPDASPAASGAPYHRNPHPPAAAASRNQGRTAELDHSLGMYRKPRASVLSTLAGTLPPAPGYAMSRQPRASMLATLAGTIPHTLQHLHPQAAAAPPSPALAQSVLAQLWGRPGDMAPAGSGGGDGVGDNAEDDSGDEYPELRKPKASAHSASYGASDGGPGVGDGSERHGGMPAPLPMRTNPAWRRPRSRSDSEFELAVRVASPHGTPREGSKWPADGPTRGHAASHAPSRAPTHAEAARRGKDRREDGGAASMEERGDRSHGDILSALARQLRQPSQEAGAVQADRRTRHDGRGGVASSAPRAELEAACGHAGTAPERQQRPSVLMAWLGSLLARGSRPSLEGAATTTHQERASLPEGAASPARSPADSLSRQRMPARRFLLAPAVPLPAAASPQRLHPTEVLRTLQASLAEMDAQQAMRAIIQRERGGYNY